MYLWIICRSRFLNLTDKVHPTFMEHLPVKVSEFNSQGPSCIYGTLASQGF